MKKNASTVLITGTSSGFGLLTALEFAKEGYTVIATMRDLAKEDNLIYKARLEGVAKQIKVCRLDVTEFEEIDRSIAGMIDQFGKIDILVNNAGFALGGFAEDVSVDEWKQQFDTNFFGVVAVTNAVLPYMRERGKGRIINVSSISGLVGFPGLSPYVSSKHALEGYSESLRQELKPFNIDVCLIEPGSYETNIWSTGKSLAKKAQDESSPYYEQMRKMEKHLELQQPHLQDPAGVAKVIVKIAKTNKPKLRYITGKGTRLGLIIKTVLPSRWWDRIIQSSIKKIN